VKDQLLEEFRNDYITTIEMCCKKDSCYGKQKFTGIEEHHHCKGWSTEWLNLVYDIYTNFLLLLYWSL